MDNHLAKFVFLAVMIGAVLFSRMAYQAAIPANLAEVNKAQLNAAALNVPTLILPSITVSATSGAVSNTAQAHAAPIAANPAAPPILPYAASLVANITTGATYETTNAAQRWPTASLAKLMSATIVLDKIDPATKITVTEPMSAADPQELTLVVGGTYTVSDLLNLMLLPSSNVAAEAVASFYGRDAFIAEMNARAAEWGMADTHFDDPSGISVGDESTANDFLKLAQKIYNGYPRIFQITRTPQATITEQNSGSKITIKSINDFAGRPDFVGGKTGHTDQANGNLLSVFHYGTHAVFVVVLGSDNRFRDTQTLYDWFKAL